jgi:hypothetical protein
MQETREQLLLLRVKPKIYQSIISLTCPQKSVAFREREASWRRAA